MVKLIPDTLKYFSRIHKTNGDRNENKLRIGLGLPGGSVQGPVLVGVLQALNERKIPYDWVVAKSIGADVAAAYEGLRLKYELDPDRYKKFPGGPIEELAHLIITRSPLFRFYKIRELPNQRGFVDITRLIDLVKETTEERELSHFPRLKIVAHIVGTTKNVIFGDVAKDYPAWKATAASSSLSGVLDGWDYDGTAVPGVLNTGQVINDGGTLRISTLREIYAMPLDLRICAFLGHVSHANELIAERAQPISMGMIGKLRIDKRLIEKASSDYEWARLAGGDRERYDFENDIGLLTNGKTLEQVMAGAEEGLMVIAPRYEHVRFSTRYPVERLMRAGEKDGLTSIDTYFKSPQRQSTLRRVVAGNGLSVKA